MPSEKQSERSGKKEPTDNLLTEVCAEAARLRSLAEEAKAEYRAFKRIRTQVEAHKTVVEEFDRSAVTAEELQGYYDRAQKLGSEVGVEVEDHEFDNTLYLRFPRLTLWLMLFALGTAGVFFILPEHMPTLLFKGATVVVALTAIVAVFARHARHQALDPLMEAIQHVYYRAQLKSIRLNLVAESKEKRAKEAEADCKSMVDKIYHNQD